eukprot:TRINITY_DN9587_c0_g1_i2.p1 TRINITY_DN9587_c0_g1~~TRINITY_DN9587_c0_g1_i2.p1  ORF type:complete len:185 (-),score=32.66 TRINITY_DN9587_c0_g1_i2:78-632(-)
MSRTFNQLFQEYSQPFSSDKLTESQNLARTILSENIEEILHTKGRERHLFGLTKCVMDCAPEDEEELISPGSFSQFRFYQPFAEELVSFEDKFDFLLLCIHHWICTIQPRMVERFVEILSQILHPPPSSIPVVLEGANDVHLVQNPRAILEDLEKEQDAWEAEKLRKEVGTLFGWQLASMPACN